MARSKPLTEAQHAALESLDKIEASLRHSTHTREMADLLHRAIVQIEAAIRGTPWPTCELCGEPAGEGNALCPACMENR